MMMNTRYIIILSSCLTLARAFVPLAHSPITAGPSSALDSTAETAEDATASVSMDPKEIVKLFGRLADKYILLDSSGGMCCYSGCTDCEYRLPGGGYRMTDQTASRPKWICSYDDRSFESSGKEHESKWSLELYKDGALAVTKDEFVANMVEMKYNPPLGGPYLGASSAGIEDTSAVEQLFDILAGEKEKLTKHRMGSRIKEIADGEEGLTWAGFSEKLLTQ